MVDTDDTRHTTDAGRRTMPRVWHQLPTGELKISIDHANNNKTDDTTSDARILPLNVVYN